MPNRQQAIIWTNAHPIHRRIYAELSEDELNSSWIPYHNIATYSVPSMSDDEWWSPSCIPHSPCSTGPLDLIGYTTLEAKGSGGNGGGTAGSKQTCTSFCSSLIDFCAFIWAVVNIAVNKINHQWIRYHFSHACGTIAKSHNALSYQFITRM